jgi:hypothetical protein
MKTQLLYREEEEIPVFENESSRPEDDIRWRLAVRVAESPNFASAPLLAKFLLFVCERTIANRTEDLTERNIGIVVFKRRPDFKTSEDNIVRTYARQLRQRLDRYFEEHELDEPLRILVPRGKYCAVFEERIALPRLVTKSFPEKSESEKGALAIAPMPAGSEPEETPSRRRGVWAAVLVLGLLLAGIAGGSVWTLQRAAAAEAAGPVWKEIFQPSMETMIVSADSGLVVLEEFSGKPATLEEYSDGSYFTQFDHNGTEEERKLQRLSRERYTGVPDVNAAVAMTSLPEARKTHVLVRNARAVHVEDMKGVNLILLGSAYSTPWVTLYEPQMNFRFRFDQTVYSSYFLNNRPQPGEPEIYRNGSTSPPYSTYAVIGFLPNIDGSGRVLAIEGLTTAGTEAAYGFLLHGEIGAFLKTVPRDANGLRPFEILLKTTSVSSSASTVEIVAKRVY